MKTVTLSELPAELRALFEAKGTATVGCELESLEDTDRLGEVLQSALPDGTVVALCGTLGAGKTRLVEAVAKAAGVPTEAVTSPTFVLIQEYRSGCRPIFHFDVYRLRDEDEFLQLGPEEYFDADGLTFIEWAEKVEDCLPKHHMTIRLTPTGATARSVEIQLQ